MENFSGVLVCATNFQKHMDIAVMRRFSHKINFDYLSPDGNEVFFQKILSHFVKRPLNDDETARLKSIKSLAPGDFKVVFQQFAFEGEASVDQLLASLEQETLYRRSRDSKIIQALGRDWT